jgi:mannose-1-phosphate guanylyltransferase
MKPITGDPWAILLAGGEGSRLRSLTQRITGDGRPKQFCPVLDGETLLEATRRRVGLAVRPDRHVVIVTRAHADYYGDQAGTMLPGRLVVQPANRGTAAAIVYALLTVRALAGDVPVAIFPTDQDVADDRAFMRHVESAVEVTRLMPDRVVLLGIEPTRPESDYGWIEPARERWFVGGNVIHAIRRFWEKPSPGLTETLFARGCLWNSFVMIGTVRGFLDLVRFTLPALTARFEGLARVLGSADEPEVAEAVYDRTASLSFSETVLARCPSALLTLPVADSGWCDLGSPARVLAALRRTGRRPGWLAGTELASSA